jgi:hypothetical protein
MITLLQQANEIEFSRNPISIIVSATDANGQLFGATSNGVTITFDANLGLSNGQVITVTTLINSIQTAVLFTATTLYSSIEEIPEMTAYWNSPSQIDNYYLIVRDKIQQHPLLSPLLSCQYLGNAEILVRLKDTEIDNTVTILTTATSATTTAIAATPDTTPPNYHLSFELFFEKKYNSGNYVSITKARHNAPIESRYEVDIAEKLHVAAIEDLQIIAVPPWNNSFNYIADNLRRHYLRVSEYQDIPATFQSHIVTEVTKIMRGGVSILDTTFYHSTIDATNSILTNFPDRKLVARNQSEWLLWYNYQTANFLIDNWGVLLETKCYDNHNTLIGTYIKGADWQARPKHGECVLVPVGATQLSLHTNTAKYTVRVIDADLYTSISAVAYLSQMRTFYIDEICYEEVKYIQYLNSFGGVETLRCKGKSKVSLEITRFKSNALGTRKSYYGFNAQTDEDQDTIWTYRTGFMTAKEAEALQELFIYNQAWEVSSDGALPIDLLTTKFEISETWRDLHAYDLTFKLKYQERNYLNKKATDRVFAWALDGSGYWLQQNDTPFIQ